MTKTKRGGKRKKAGVFIDKENPGVTLEFEFS